MRLHLLELLLHPLLLLLHLLHLMLWVRNEGVIEM